MPTNVGTIEYDARIDTKQFKRDAASLEKTAETTGKNVESGFSKFLSSGTVAAVTKGFLAAGAAMAVAGGFAVSSASDFQQNRIAFDTMLGSADKAKDLLKEVSDFARRTPFELPEVVTGAKQLLAYGIEAEKIIPTLTNLGNIAAGVGRDKLPQLFLAFGQVRAAGKLTGMELRQFTEAGVPLLEVLAEQSGKTAAQIKEAMENGAAPSFAEVESALASMSKEGGRFFNLMDRQSKTFGGTMSNVKDQIGRVARAIVGIDETGEIREGSIFARLTKAAKTLLDFLEQNGPTIEKIIVGVFDAVYKVVDSVADAIGSVVSGIKSLAETLSGSKETLGAFGGQMYHWYTVIKDYLEPRLAAIAGFIGTIARVVGEHVIPQFKALYKVFNEEVKPELADLIDALKDLWEALNPGLTEALKVVGIVIGVLVFGTLSIFIQVIKLAAQAVGGFADFLGKTISVIAAVIEWFGKAGVAIWQFLVNTKNTISNVLSGLPQTVKDIGSAIIDGLIKGIDARTGGLISLVQKIAGTIKDTFKKALDIRSPSKVFAGYGQNIAAGLALGMDRNSSLVTGAVNRMTSSLGVGSLDADIGGSPANQYSIGNINIAKEVDGERWIQRLTREQVAIGGGLNYAA